MVEHILTGYRVLDLTHVLAGPTATRMMAEMGAEVIKVEFPPLGDIARSLPVKINGRSGYYVQQNRGKKSISVDIKTESGKLILEDLIRCSDVLIENFAPGVISRLGFGWDKISQLNSRVVMCSISAFGQEGEMSGLPGFDYIASAYSGIMGVTGEKTGAPSFPMAGIGDVMTGANAFAAIGYALLHREKSGKGQFLDISLIDSYMHCHEVNIEVYELSQKKIIPTRSGHHHYAVCPLGLFKGNSRYICIIALENQWSALCEAMGKPELIRNQKFCTNEKRVEHSVEVISIVQKWIDQVGDDDKIIRLLEEKRVPCGPVLTVDEVVENKSYRARGTIRKIVDPKLGEFYLPGMPIRFSDFEHNQPLEASSLGEDNQAILEGVLGYSPKKISDLAKRKVIFSDSNT